ncbi:LysR family transcriptional regulator ArgP [Paracoccus sp. p4-l81]|uniref:LysR family transcriptional regulator ArgP n=1 Tax=unclassified Paracoccus (in: a-proteobacteria) TaxID=2688777 RepID=UPI0035B851DF
MNIDYPAARAVALVVQTGSFERAAERLHVTPSAVSQRVRGLEDRLGVALIDRGSPCTATPAGAWLCRHVDHVALLEAQLMDQLPGPPRGAAQVTLAIAANADSLGTWFLTALADFGAGRDHLFDIALDDEDHTADWLARGRVLAAVTAEARPVAGCIVHPLGSLRYHATASPGFVARHFAGGMTEAAVAAAPSMMFNAKDRLQSDWLGLHLGHDIPRPAHVIPATQAFVDAALAGIGWGMNPAMLVAEHLATGRLVELIPGAVLDKPLFWQVNRLAAPALAGLTQAVRTAAARALVTTT